jgi:hypothetical protein
VFWCKVVPQASKPAVPGWKSADALQAAGPVLDKALITTDVGMAGVRGLLINDLTTDNDTNPLGVTLRCSRKSFPPADRTCKG